MRRVLIPIVALIVLILAACAPEGLSNPFAQPPSVAQPPAVGQQTPPGGGAVQPMPGGQQQGSSTSSRVVTSSAPWPSSPADAAARFAPGSDGRWEKTAEGRGWHLREEGFRTLVTPVNAVLEGYYDTNPGRDPRQFVSLEPIEVQGATVWPLTDTTAQKLFCQMGNQKYRLLNLAFSAWQAGIDAVGFSKPSGCEGENPTGASTQSTQPSAQAAPAGPAAPSTAPSAWVSDPAATLGVPEQRSAQADQWEGCPNEPGTCWHLKDGSVSRVNVTDSSTYEGWDGSKVISGPGPAQVNVAGLTVRQKKT